MKNLTLFALGFLIICPLLISCNKTYQCSCTHPFINGPYKVEIKGATRAAAKKECYETGKDKGQPTYDGPFDCHLVD